jgi:hypothetical protein
MVEVLSFLYVYMFITNLTIQNVNQLRFMLFITKFQRMCIMKYIYPKFTLLKQLTLKNVLSVGGLHDTPPSIMYFVTVYVN